MSWDFTPWFIGGGAVHSPEVARLMAYAATSGAEGVVVPGDLKVLPLAVPGTSVRVSIGAALILNRSTGGAAQTYVARNPTEDVVGIAPTGSSGGRSDLIVAQVEDPNMPGEPWTTPSDPTTAQYIYTRVIPNVPAGTTRLQDVPGYSGRSAITLARIDLPANTGTVQSSMIVDLRSVALPRSQRAYSVQAATVSGDATLTATTEVVWPPRTATVFIPEWATHIEGAVELSQFEQRSGNEFAQHRVRIGASLYSDVTYTDSDAATNAVVRTATSIPVRVAVPANLRGTTQTVSVLSRRMGSASTGRFSAVKGTQLLCDLQLEERTV